MTSESRQHTGHGPDEAVPGTTWAAPDGTAGARADEQPPFWAGGSPAPNDSWLPQPTAGVRPAADPTWAPSGAQAPADTEPVVPSPAGGAGFPPSPWGAPPPAPGNSTDHVPQWAPPPVRDAGADSPPAWAPPGSGNGFPSTGGEPASPEAAAWAGGPAWAGPQRGTAPYGTGQPEAPRQMGQTEQGQPTPGRYEPAPQEPIRPEAPLYQPAPAPGLAGATAVPLPPQPTRVPGASLAASPPADFSAAGYPSTSAHHGGGSEFPAPVSGNEQAAQPAASAFAANAAAPVVPPQRRPSDIAVTGRVSVPQPNLATAAEPGPTQSATAPVSQTPAVGSVSASASVPLSSRVMPPTDHALRPGAIPTPRSRVYGRPVATEQTAEPGYHVAGDAVPQTGFAPGSSQATGPADQAGRGQAPGAGSVPGPVPFGAPGTAGPAAFSGPTATSAPFGGPTMAPRPEAGGEQPSWAAPAPATDHPGWGTPAPTPGGTAAPGLPYRPTPAGAPAWVATADPGEQDRFNAFRPETQPAADPKSEAPVPQVRNGRVLLAVLTAAVLILTIPLGILYLLGKIGGEPAFNPAIGECVKQSGSSVAVVNCGEPDAFKVVSRVADKSECAEPDNPYVSLSDTDEFLCLTPATTGEAPTSAPSTAPTSDPQPSSNG